MMWIKLLVISFTPKFVYSVQFSSVQKYLYLCTYMHVQKCWGLLSFRNPLLHWQRDWEQLVGAGQMKDRNSSNLSVELGDNRGAGEVAHALRDSSLALAFYRHNRGGRWVAGQVKSVGLSGRQAEFLHLYFVPLANWRLVFFLPSSQIINEVMNYAEGNASLCQAEWVIISRIGREQEKDRKKVETSRKCTSVCAGDKISGAAWTK